MVVKKKSRRNDYLLHELLKKCPTGICYASYADVW